MSRNPLILHHSGCQHSLLRFFATLMIDRSNSNRKIWTEGPLTGMETDQTAEACCFQHLPPALHLCRNSSQVPTVSVSWCCIDPRQV